MKDTDSLRIATLRGPSAVGMAPMMDGAAGFADAVVDVFDEPQRLLAEMSAGNVDFAVLPTSMTGILQKKGLDYRLAAVMIWGGLYVCGADSGIGRLEDLKGRTVSVMAGGTPPDGVFSLDCLRCVGACGLAPVMTVNGKVYGNVDPRNVREILENAAGGKA